MCKFFLRPSYWALALVFLLNQNNLPYLPFKTCSCISYCFHSKLDLVMIFFKMIVNYVSCQCSHPLSNPLLEVLPIYLWIFILLILSLASCSVSASPIILFLSLVAQVRHQVALIKFLFVQHWLLFFSVSILVKHIRPFLRSQSCPFQWLVIVISTWTC